MNEHKILHVMILDKFLPPYIDFIDEYFGRESHHYVFITSEKYQYGLTPEHNVEFLYTDDDIFITLLEYMRMAKKIILHGLWRDKVDTLLYDNQELLRKCYWVMWGGDFYFPEQQTRIRHEIIKKIAHCIPVTPEDWGYIRKHYDAVGKYHKCVNYPRSVKFPPVTINHIEASRQKVLIGNSATETNNHLKIFDKLKKYPDIQIYVPLSYGNKEYAQAVIEEGYKLFPDRFFPLTKYMDYDEYVKFLAEIDIAVFGQNRQQGVGNLVILLGMGKTVLLGKENNAKTMFEEMGIRIKEIEDFEISEITYEEKIANHKTILDRYSEDRSKVEWKQIFED